MNLLNYFPNEIPFYEIGKITLNNKKKENIKSLINKLKSAFIYKISCNKTFNINYIVFPKNQELETSMAAEMGNLIASQVASSSDSLILSPPKNITGKGLDLIKNLASQIKIKNYQYLSNGKTIEIPILFINQKSKGEIDV